MAAKSLIISSLALTTIMGLAIFEPQVSHGPVDHTIEVPRNAQLKFQVRRLMLLYRVTRLEMMK